MAIDNYDERCEMLAAVFLTDNNVNRREIRPTFTEADIKRLAGEIQQTIEDFIEAHDRPKSKLPPADNTPEVRTCLRLLRQAVRRDGEAGTCKAVAECIGKLVSMAGLTHVEAARVVYAENRLLFAVVMDRIGLIPASDIEFRAVQEVWNAHR